jgi:hypothetical protein
MKKLTIKISVLTVMTGTFLSSCSKDPNSPGYEYMPDMYRGPAIEAYVDYGVVKGKEYDELKKTQSARLPVEGTIVYHEDATQGAFYFPYPYENNFDGYEAAGAEYKRPFEFTEETVKRGKRIYENFCQQCHGKEGAGDGPTVTAGGYPAPPAYVDRLVPEGKMFHTITYGKGLMGPHASLLNKEERWEVISYVLHLQEKALKDK